MFRYDIEWFVGDDGCKVSRLILHAPAEVQIADLSPDKFCIYVNRTDKDGKTMFAQRDWKTPGLLPTKGYLTVRAAYPSTADGTPVRRGAYITLETDTTEMNTGAIIGTLTGSSFVNTDFTITQIAPIGALVGMVFDEKGETFCPQTVRWAHGRSTYAPMPLPYGFYTPDAVGKRPLIIWLHGAGEGGTDPRVTYMGNRVVALSSDPIQRYFGGAYVLAPTCPTMWMDDGSHEYGHTGKSMYSEALIALIKEFVASHPIDEKRIYVGGCSNGGFMTMRLIADNPGYFAAGYPMCEALYDDTITETELQNLAGTPIWMLHAMTDGVVNPEETAVATYKRLVAAGAKNVHFTYIDDRPPFHEMVNHGCWVPGLNEVFNDDFDGSPVLVDGKPATRFQWVAAQSLT